MLKILPVLLLTSLVVSFEQLGDESPAPGAYTQIAQFAPTKRAPSPTFEIDIPSLLGKHAQQVKGMMGAKHGAPTYFIESSKGDPGIVAWTINGLLFKFYYYQNGDIGMDRDGMFKFRGFPQGGRTVAGMMRAGNLIKDSRDYVLEIDDFEDLIEVRVIPVRT